MPMELDHVFLCANAGAPEAEQLVQFGLREGTPNRHPGQGTACRRFACANAMIELVWVDDPVEAQNEATRRTRLWERWRDREGGASPFGICVRPGGSQISESPFPGWEYRPAYLDDPLFMLIGDASVREPLWVHLGFLRLADREKWFVEHPSGLREITGLTLTTPEPLRSPASKAMVESGILAVEGGPRSLLTIDFDHRRLNLTKDFRPHLPLVFQY
jgi:hypothetical protein